MELRFCGSLIINKWEFYGLNVFFLDLMGNIIYGIKQTIVVICGDIMWI